MKKLFLFFLLVINSSLLGMWHVCSHGVDDTPDGVWQKIVFDDADHRQDIYQYNEPSHRWRLVQQRYHADTKTNYTSRFYLKRNNQVEVYEAENGVGELKLVKTLTIDQHNQLDLQEDGQFVTGN